MGDSAGIGGEEMLTASCLLCNKDLSDPRYGTGVWVHDAELCAKGAAVKIAHLLSEAGRLRAIIVECIQDWREIATATEHCQRSAGDPVKKALNERSVAAYRHCADDLELSIKEMV